MPLAASEQDCGRGTVYACGGIDSRKRRRVPTLSLGNRRSVCDFGYAGHIATDRRLEAAGWGERDDAAAGYSGHRPDLRRGERRRRARSLSPHAASSPARIRRSPAAPHRRGRRAGAPERRRLRAQDRRPTRVDPISQPDRPRDLCSPARAWCAGRPARRSSRPPAPAARSIRCGSASAAPCARPAACRSTCSRAQYEPDAYEVALTRDWPAALAFDGRGLRRRPDAARRPRRDQLRQLGRGRRDAAPDAARRARGRAAARHGRQRRRGASATAAAGTCSPRPAAARSA